MRLIDADALAKFIDYGHLNNPNEKLYSENDIREMIDMMPTQPTIDAVPVKHGRWITPWGHENARVCLQCKMICHADNATFYVYCPNCGAKMDGEEE